MLSKFCFSHPEAADQDFQNFFFRADTEDYAYLLRLNPNREEYCMYCYCFRRDWLDQHLQESRRGIRFINVLLFDGLQNIVDKYAVSSEFIRMLMEMSDSGKHLVIAADKPPKEIAAFNVETHGRLMSGLLIGLEDPDFETKGQFFELKLRRCSLRLLTRFCLLLPLRFLQMSGF